MVDKCFAGTASRLSGVTFEMLAQEVCTYSPFSAQWHMPNQWSVNIKCKIIIIFGSLFYRHWTSIALHILTENVTTSSSTTRYSRVFTCSWSFNLLCRPRSCFIILPWLISMIPILVQLARDHESKGSSISIVLIVKLMWIMLWLVCV